ncbi:uncharacterized protein LAJ45_10976 [Morchella importuna]|uniref:uncharacterized protein n=1 Tax=Morchella importuna TaxID=1174673 RepID=UPI001E8E477D|nr:uncharacterized protein LAJ45_10976 [Morchella importuna]KAH8145065.1 hypothetical protein LAJ45_10976 [Morchella importuna]
MSINNIPDAFDEYFKQPPTPGTFKPFCNEPNIRTLIHDIDPQRSKRAGELLRKWSAKGHKSDKALAKRFHTAAQSPRPKSKVFINRTQIETNLGKVYTGRILKLKKPRNKKADTPDTSVGSADTSVGCTDSPPDSTESAEPDTIYLMELDPAEKLCLPTGKYLEDIILRYARSVEALDLSHWRIIDSADIELRAILHRHLWESLPELNEDYPQCPAWFSAHADKYKMVRDLPASYRISPHSLPFTQSTAWAKGPGKVYIGTLLTSLSRTCLIYGFKDATYLYLVQQLIPRFLLTPPTAMTVLFSHDSLVISPRFWSLAPLKCPGDGKVVHHDAETVKKLSVVGIIQAGPNTMVFIMRCVGPNLYTLRRGSRHSLPNHIAHIHTLDRVLAAIWIARECIQNSYRAVSEYMAHPGSQRYSNSMNSPSFL